jgi:hypothetical protein
MMPHPPRGASADGSKVDMGPSAFGSGSTPADELRPGHSVVLVHKIVDLKYVDIDGRLHVEVTYEDGLVQKFAATDGVPTL